MEKLYGKFVRCIIRIILVVMKPKLEKLSFVYFSS